MNQAEQLARRALILRCQLGDEAAFARLLAAHHPRLAYFVRRMLDSPQDAEDVLQETWLAVHRKMPALAEPEAFVAWLYGIARHKAWHALRRGGQPPAVALDAEDLSAAEVDTDFGPEDAAAVHRALGKLPPLHREVLILRFMDEMSYEQIAAAIGCGVGTIKSRMHNAKKLLKREMESTNHDGK